MDKSKKLFTTKFSNWECIDVLNKMYWKKILENKVFSRNSMWEL